MWQAWCMESSTGVLGCTFLQTSPAVAADNTTHSSTRDSVLLRNILILSLPAC
mgnify:CR=1 FL=1|jgi:hypothetical protein